MAQETGKQRAARIPLDYFKRPDPLQRGKTWLTGLALLLVVVWLASSLLRSDQGKLLYTHGPLAAVHATWEAECSVCHIDFTPIGSKRGAGMFLNPTRASDQLCETCHAGPTHHSRQIEAEKPACADCHRDHQGRDVSLVRLADSDCTQCHANLGIHTQIGDMPLYENVTRFAARRPPDPNAGHPEFKIVRNKTPDPGKIRFNHQQHMTAGMALAPGSVPNRKVNIPFTLASIDDSERERYRLPGQKKENDQDNVVQLDCTSCHRLDSGDFGVPREQLSRLPVSAVLPPRSAGAYLQPIVYENQCKACHPLTLEGAKPKDRLAIPHRLQPDAVHGFLEQNYQARYLADNPDLLGRFLAPRAIPGKPKAELTKDEEKLGAHVADSVLAAERILFVGKQTCGECHQFTTPSSFVELEKLKLKAVPEFRVQPAAVPDIWYQHASFDHSAHRAVECRACHPRAYPDSPEASTESADVLVPGIANCLQCHASPSRGRGEFRGGARFDCTECHRYHHGDFPAQGIGDAARDARQKRGVELFLSGARPRQPLKE